MEEWRKSIGSCWKKIKSTLSTAMFLWVMVPLLVVSGMVMLLVANSKGYSWTFASGYGPSLWRWPSTSNYMITGTTSFGNASTALSTNVVQDPDSLSPVPQDHERGVSVGYDHSLHPPPGLVGVGDHIFNLSAPPPQVIEAGETNKQPIERDGDGVKEEVSNNSVPIQPRNDGDHHVKKNEGPPNVTVIPRSKKRYSSLEILEAGLSEARVAIKEAKSGQEAPNDDFVPKGPMYRNATAFHRSYLEMEKRFKVFVYEEGDPPVFHYGPCKHTYAIEGYFIQAMEVTPFRTSDPSKAHVFYLSFSVSMITQVIYIRENPEWNLMKRAVADYVNVIAHKHPHWNRSLGMDHFMLACHDWGPELSFAVPHLYKNSIRAFCNANTSERFVPSKDVSIPEIHLPLGTTEGMMGGPPPSERPTLVFFAGGGDHGPIRPILLDYWENKDEDVQVHKYLPKGISYYGMMRKSRYCICPSGYEVASPRTVEALYMGCVPVLIKEGYVIPFSDVLNWKAFSVIIPVKDIPNLKKILMAIPQRQYFKMQHRGIQVRRHFEMNTLPKRYDVFHMILHSIWLRRLNFRVEDVNES